MARFYTIYMRRILPGEWMITDAKIIDPLKAASTLPINSGIILRDYDMGRDKKLQLGRELKKICVRKKLILLVANDPQLAIKIKADGIHLPEHAVGKIRFWRQKKNRWIITAAAHSRRAVKYAAKNGADAVMISPVFITASHAEKKPLGILRAMKFINYEDKKTLAAYALGGVKNKHDNLLKMAGFQGFAAISRFKN